jgi:hypothetical protein
MNTASLTPLQRTIVQKVPQMEKKTATLNPPVMLKEQITALIAKREKWEKNQYQSSTALLYGLLAECLEITLRLSRKNNAEINAFNDLLAEHNIKKNESTQLETRVVRLAFGDCGRRDQIYGNVLFHAMKSSIEPKGLPTWIQAQGGVENVGQSKGASGSMKVQRKELVQLAAAEMETADFQIELEPLQCLEPSNKEYVTLSIAIIRKTDGKFGIVYGTNHKSLLEQALAQAGKDLKLTQATAQIVSEAKDLETVRRTATQMLHKKHSVSKRPKPSKPDKKAA